jgi:hypothetical protein
MLSKYLMHSFEYGVKIDQQPYVLCYHLNNIKEIVYNNMLAFSLLDLHYSYVLFLQLLRIVLLF